MKQVQKIKSKKKLYFFQEIMTTSQEMESPEELIFFRKFSFIPAFIGNLK